MLVHRRVAPSIFKTCCHPFLHLGGERHCESKVLPKNTTQWPWPRLEPRPLNPGTSALFMRTPCLPKQLYMGQRKSINIALNLQQSKIQMVMLQYQPNNFSAVLTQFHKLNWIWGFNNWLQHSFPYPNKAILTMWNHGTKRQYCVQLMVGWLEVYLKRLFWQTSLIKSSQMDTETRHLR